MEKVIEASADIYWIPNNSLPFTLKKIALSTLKQKLWSSLWLIYHQYFKMCKNIFFA